MILKNVKRGSCLNVSSFPVKLTSLKKATKKLKVLPAENTYCYTRVRPARPKLTS